MFSLADMTLVMLFAACCAWLWRGHGIRERALRLARQHCAKLDIELLDENVALRGLRLQRDGRGHLRLARLYDFEFTVTGDQRLRGNLSMFGQQLGHIELDAHPHQTTAQDSANVVHIAEWKRSHPSLPPRRDGSDG